MEHTTRVRLRTHVGHSCIPKPSLFSPAYFTGGPLSSGRGRCVCVPLLACLSSWGEHHRPQQGPFQSRWKPVHGHVLPRGLGPEPPLQNRRLRLCALGMPPVGSRLASHLLRSFSAWSEDSYLAGGVGGARCCPVRFRKLRRGLRSSSPCLPPPEEWLGGLQKKGDRSLVQAWGAGWTLHRLTWAPEDSRPGREASSL